MLQWMTYETQRWIKLLEKDELSSLPSHGAAGLLNSAGEQRRLFLLRGRLLTHPQLVSELRSALAAAGFKPGEYDGHSFQIGAATTAVACDIPVDMIKILGRWKSQAYHLYIRIPDTELATISKSLAVARV